MVAAASAVVASKPRMKNERVALPIGSVSLTRSKTIAVNSATGRNATIQMIALRADSLTSQEPRPSLKAKSGNRGYRDNVRSGHVRTCRCSLVRRVEWDPPASHSRSTALFCCGGAPP